MTELLARLPPGSLLMLGALLVPLLRGRTRQVWLLALPLLSFAHLWSLPTGTTVDLTLFGYTLQPVRVDGLSMVWGVIYHLAAVLTAIFAFHVRDRVEQTAAPLYVGSAIAAAFAGDLISLFVFWELTAISSVFLIWVARHERAYRAGMRYLIVQVGSGVLLLAGSALWYRDSGSLAFGEIGLGSTAGLLIFLAFGIKCAFPLLHNWLQDAYPESTATGAVFLSAFTTKLAVYALARGFAGESILIPIGAVMTAFPIFYAVIENDLRRVLAYNLNNQLGFMVVGIGIGTEMALNGTAAHAFCHILYKALLFMSMGAVLYRTGTCNGSELGGLRKSMPWTALFCTVGGITTFPLFSGFVSKSLIVSETAEAHRTWVYLVLLFGSAGAFLLSGIKIPYLAFFAHDSGKRCKEAPPHMLLAMGLTAALCVGLGCYWYPLYALLPYPIDPDWHVYSPSHVVTQLQLLLFSALAFGFLQLVGWYPPELRSTNLDGDWSYRRLLPRTAQALLRAGGSARAAFHAAWPGRTLAALALRPFQPGGTFARSWTTAGTAAWVTVLLGLTLLLYFS